MHDEEVDRTTNGKGLIREKTLEELKKLNAGGKFSKEFPAAKVPELKEVLGLLLQKNYRGMLMIEIKTDQYEYPGIEEKLAETLKSRDWPFSTCILQLSFGFFGKNRVIGTRDTAGLIDEYF